ncbi:hypothetical protein KSP40_PGU018961 [Platanthera guangdongensis]|uniref:Uncharacterized protein n=1 Tax=Platanthera guangdongensis TaxID=2320717 RepID=A0ABR2LCT2_9ASPA
MKVTFGRWKGYLYDWSVIREVEEGCVRDLVAGKWAGRARWEELAGSKRGADSTASLILALQKEYGHEKVQQRARKIERKKKNTTTYCRRRDSGRRRHNEKRRWRGEKNRSVTGEKPIVWAGIGLSGRFGTVVAIRDGAIGSAVETVFLNMAPPSS